jgi:hypothetical protein
MNQRQLAVLAQTVAKCRPRVSRAGYAKIKRELYGFLYGAQGTCFEEVVLPGAVVNPCKATRHTNPDGSFNPDLYIAPKTR